ncbi:hypothetical protein [Limosilactobacillus mucosae]|uniref:hypothetical protein n=1 Tax=Limosilactobacillus mucosae TaxID=97478 RepID=UPI0025A466AA|nr:hypothetical protein [Limosilactobacillus mucosae]MDM8220013.1 hypothetical protein [Limosilactobacillus mucosae]MDM8314669.1 hypothetical protein [Limosilactobacillus mucosae]
MEKVGILLVSIVLAALIVWKFVLPDYHKKKYVRMVLWSILALGFVSAGIQGPTPADKKAASSSSAQSSSKAKSSSAKESSTKTSSASSSNAKSSSKKESSTKTSSSKKKSDSINDKLMKSLTEDQGWANGTLDKDGNPVQNGEKFPQFNWATHVQKILWKDNGIEVYIYDADNLTESQLTTVAQSAQSEATAILLTEEKISDNESTQGVHTTVYSGNEVIGHSKVFSPKEFKWTN